MGARDNHADNACKNERAVSIPFIVPHQKNFKVFETNSVRVPSSKTRQHYPSRAKESPEKKKCFACLNLE